MTAEEWSLVPYVLGLLVSGIGATWLALNLAHRKTVRTLEVDRDREAARADRLERALSDCQEARIGREDRHA